MAWAPSIASGSISASSLVPTAWTLPLTCEQRATSPVMEGLAFERQPHEGAAGTGIDEGAVEESDAAAREVPGVDLEVGGRAPRGIHGEKHGEVAFDDDARAFASIRGAAFFHNFDEGGPLALGEAHSLDVFH